MKKKRYAMVINLEKCLGCNTCTIACNMENSVMTTCTWHVVLDTIQGTYPDFQRKFIPRPCFHCDEHPCVKVCTTGASHVKKENGIVLVDHRLCIGCRTCMTACPYEARVFNWRKPERPLTENPVVPVRRIGTVEKCTFCVHRLDDAEKRDLAVGTTTTQRDNQKVVAPACVQECVGNARYFGDLNDKQSEVYELLKKQVYKRLEEEAGTEPNVYYIGL